MAAQGASAVSHRAQMPLPTLSNYMKGRDMKASALVKLAAACNVSIEWLATGQGAGSQGNGRYQEVVSEDSIFGRDLLESPANFSILMILLRSCQESFRGQDRPQLRTAFRWVAQPYRQGHLMSDRYLEFKDPSDPKS